MVNHSVASMQAFNAAISDGLKLFLYLERTSYNRFIKVGFEFAGIDTDLISFYRQMDNGEIKRIFKFVPVASRAPNEVITETTYN